MHTRPWTEIKVINIENGHAAKLKKKRKRNTRAKVGINPAYTKCFHAALTVFLDQARALALSAEAASTRAKASASRAAASCAVANTRSSTRTRTHVCNRKRRSRVSSGGRG